MHLFKRTFLLAAVLVLSFHSYSQLDSSRPVKVAVFVPLYLDSAFSGLNYKLGNNALPKFLLPGLEFYNGVMMAIDSLQKERQQLEVMIYDTKSKGRPLNAVLQEQDMQQASFILASFTTREELRAVADFSLINNIPLISATYPNDGGISANPNLAIINPTLLTHIEGIYKYVQRNHSMDDIVLVKRKNDQMDEMIRYNFDESLKKYRGKAINVRYIELGNTFNPQDIIKQLDSNKTSVVIGATLNNTFAANIVRTLSSVKGSYKSVAIGMPTWDNMSELNKSDTRGVEIVYSTPYKFTKGDRFLGRLAATYRDNFNGRASDMVFKGYESMYHFTKLYLKYPGSNAFKLHLSDKDFRITNDFDFQPVRSKDNTTIDYFENKKLYYVTKLDGVVKTIN